MDNALLWWHRPFFFCKIAKTAAKQAVLTRRIAAKGQGFSGRFPLVNIIK